MLKRKFYQVYMDFDQYFSPKERMNILRVIAANPDIDYVDVTPKQAVFKAVGGERQVDLNNSPLEIKVGCSWIQVSCTILDLANDVAEKLMDALQKPREEVEA